MPVPYGSIEIGTRLDRIEQDCSMKEVDMNGAWP